MNPLLEVFNHVVGQPHFRYLLYLVAANIVVKLALVLVKGEFQLPLLASWLQTRLIPLLLGYGAAVLVAEGMARPEIELAAFVALTGTLVAHTAQALRDGGIEIPLLSSTFIAGERER